MTPPENGAPATRTNRRPELLIVEDDGGVRRVLRAAMHHYGFGVFSAADAPEAVEAYRRHRGTIDLVLLDVEMPGRDGPAILGDLRRVDPGVRACFMSGGAGRYTAREHVDCGALAVFPKPFSVLQMATRLRELIGPGTRGAPRSAAFCSTRHADIGEVDATVSECDLRSGSHL